MTRAEQVAELIAEASPIWPGGAYGQFARSVAEAGYRRGLEEAVKVVSDAAEEDDDEPYTCLALTRVEQILRGKADEKVEP
jgi:hypothetical protein